MSSELTLLKEELAKNNERRKELRVKHSNPDLSPEERVETSNLLEEVYEEERELERLIQKEEDILKHDEYIAEVEKILAQRVKLELELKDMSSEEKEAVQKRIAELTKQMVDALTHAESISQAHNESDDCDCGDYDDYDDGHDHLAGANGYNSY